MRTLIFFALIIGIDLFLKSIKDRKKIQEIREKKMQELRNEKKPETVRPVETIEKREIKKNPSLIKHQKENGFHGEGKSYRDDHEGYRERYEDRYEGIREEYDDIQQTYKESTTDTPRDALYDKHAIERSERKEYEDLDIRNYGRSKKKIDIPIPKASSLKKDILNGIIFSEILGKPKSIPKE